MKKHREWLKQEEIEREEAKVKYDQIQSAQGSLQELIERPMTDDERTYLVKEKKQTYCIVGVLIVITLTGVLVALLQFQNLYWAGISFAFLVLLVVGLIFISPKYNKRLKANKMYVLKGVVSYKYMHETDNRTEYRIYIGDPEDEAVFKVYTSVSQFRKIKHGDIVEVKNSTKGFQDSTSEINTIGNIFYNQIE